MKAAEDGGFILVDALLASALLAFAGTVTLTIVISAHERASEQLDRSVALTAMHSLALQFAVLTDPQRARLERSDELYRYDIAPTPGTAADLGSLKQWRVTATPLRRGEALEIAFLAR